jgi:VCBS repeat-containing protein
MNPQPTPYEKTKRMHRPNQTSRRPYRNQVWSIIGRCRCFLAIAFGLALTFGASGATSILENFTDGTLDPAFEDVDTAFEVGGGVIRREPNTDVGDRRYIRTVAADFHASDWTYDVTFTMDSMTDFNIHYVGFGEGERNPANWTESAHAVILRIHPEHLVGGRVDLAITKSLGEAGYHYIEQIGSLGRYGTFHARVQKSGNNVTLSILDANGGPISGTVNIATQAPFLDATNSRLFFGTALSGESFDDLSITTSSPPPAPTILENFTDGTLDPAFEDVDTAFEVGGGVIRREPNTDVGDRRYIRTVATDFHASDWTYDVTFTMDSTTDFNIHYVGFGEAERNPANWTESAHAVILRIHPEHLVGGRVDLAITKSLGEAGYHYIEQIGSLGRYGTFHARVQKSGNNVTLSILDANGGPISGTVNTATQTPFLNATNSRLFFGTALSGESFDDLSISVVGQPANTAPTFVGSNTTLTVNVNAGATDVKSLLHVSDADGGQTLTWSQSAAPNHGTLTISGATASSGGVNVTPGGTITYEPNLGFVGTDSFSIQVSDGTASASRTVTVNFVNAPPIFVGANATVSVNVNSGATDVTNLLHVNDSDSGQTLTWSQNAAPSHGTLTISGATATSGGADIPPNGTITYAPAPGFIGNDTFVVRVSDGIANESRSITVNVQNVAPTFVGAVSSLIVNASSGATDIKDLLHVNDPDIGETLTWSQSSAPSHGTLTISGATASSGSTGIPPGGTIAYTPIAGYVGNDSFIVQVSDGAVTATRTITVDVLNTAPVFVGSTTTLLVGLNSPGADVKGLLHVNDSDSGQTLSWSQSIVPGHGSLSFSGASELSGSTDIAPAGTITYTPAAGYFGSDSFAVQVTDGIGTATRTITVEVSPTSVSATGSMTTGRFGHRATLLANGKVLVVGGASVPASADLYDLASATFTATGSTSANLWRDHTATLLPDGKVLVAGGRSVSDALSSTELYDPNSGTFTPSAGLSMARASHTATLLPNGKVLITGGNSSVSSSQGLSSAELYDPKSGTFTATGSMSVQRASHTATLLSNGKVLVTGGGNANAEVYDPSTGQFAVTGSMSVERESHTATLLANGKVLVTGGSRPWDPALLKSAELYDPSSGTFATTGDMADGRAFHTATLLADGKVLIAAGATSSSAQALSSVELYDPSLGAFAPAQALGAGRLSHAATLLTNGEVLLTGGHGAGAEILSSAELYEVAPGTITTPAASGLTPKETKSGTGGLTVAVQGVGFVPGLVVNLNGSPRATTFHDNALLTAQILAADVPSTLDMVVKYITVEKPGVGVSGPIPFTITGSRVTAVQSTIVPPPGTGAAQTLPVGPAKPGVSAIFENNNPGSATDTLSVATYSSAPSAGVSFNTGGGFVDLQLTGADSSDRVTAKFYYNSTVPFWLKPILVLRFGNNGGWLTVKSSGGADPVNDTSANLDGTVSGGRFTVVFDNTSTPKITELNGTVFVMSIAPAVENPIANQSGTYGSAFSYTVPANTFSGEDPALLSYVASGLPPGIQFDAATRTLNGTPVAPGTFTVSITATENGLFEPLSATASFTFTVAKAPLVITAESKIKAYAAALPVLTATASGFVNGDTAASLDTLPTLSTTATPASNVGTYPIVASGATAANYSLSFVSGTLTITAVPLTVTANDAARAYGQNNPPLTGTLVGGVNNDQIIATYSTTATPTSAVGTYPIVPGLFDLNSKLGNYTVTKNNGTLTVNNVPPVVNAGPDQEKVALDEVTFAGSFADPSSPSHTIEWNFGDGSASVTGTLTPKHEYSKHGQYTVTLSVTDSHGATVSDTLLVTVISATGLAQDAAVNLAAFAGESKDIARAVASINQVLASNAWLDEMHLDAKQGHKVFSDLKSAAQDLQKVLQDAGTKGGVSAGALQAAQEALRDLAAAARLVAETLYLENQGLTAVNPKNQKQVNDSLAQAKAALEAGNMDAASGKCDNAIQNYRQSWEKIQQALALAAK